MQWLLAAGLVGFYFLSKPSTGSGAAPAAAAPPSSGSNPIQQVATTAENTASDLLANTASTTQTVASDVGSGNFGGALGAIEQGLGQDASDIGSGISDTVQVVGQDLTSFINGL